MSKKYFFHLVLTLACNFFLCAQSSIASESLDRIVATVNDAVINQSELNQAMNVIKNQMIANNMQLPPASALRKQVLEQLINKQLQLQIAEQSGVKVTDEEVTKAISMIAKDNNVTVQEIYQKTAAQGLSQEEYRNEIRDQITLQRIEQQEVGSKIVISPQEINDFLRSKTWQAFNKKEYHLEDILISLPDAPTPEQVAEAKKHAQSLLTQIRNGKNFKEAAAAESGENNALDGGDLGWRKLPEIPSAFAEKITHMQENEVSSPIQTPNGFHLVKLTGVRSINERGDPEDQNKQVQRLIYQRKFEEGLQNWITRIRSAAMINTHFEG